MNLSIAVMHHPARPELQHRIAEQLAPYPVEVVVDPDPFGPTNPWRTAREAWRRIPDDATHRLVLQDDALPCRDFVAAAHAAVEAQPRHAISFFVNWLGFQLARAQLDACDRCDAFARLPQNGWYPTVALCLPAELALALAAWEAPQRAIADDAVVASWAYHGRHSVQFLQTVPSLVDHDETVTSTISGHTVRGHGRAAACFIGDEDWRAVDWTRGPR